MSDFEKLGVSYLGRPCDDSTKTATGSPFLYDSRDLTTHGLIVGMTGSGKTGLSDGLLDKRVFLMQNVHEDGPASFRPVGRRPTFAARYG